MTTTGWITDRRPSEKDTHVGGYVRMCVSPGSEDWSLVHWSYVGAGIPWQHTDYWVPKPPLAVGQSWRRRDGEVVEITRGTDDGDGYPYYADHNWYGPDGKSNIHDCRPGLELVEFLPPPSPLEDIVKQLKELQDRIQPILDLQNNLPSN